MNKNDYLKLLQELVDQQYYDNDIQDLPEKLPPEAWIPAESGVSEKINRKTRNLKQIDVSDSKKTQIRDAIYDYEQIKVGNFLIKINSQYINKKTAIDDNTSLNISIWEKRFTTPSGNPCNMDFRLNLHKDTRFSTRLWISLFSQDGRGQVNISTLIEIIRWMQALKKMPAFL